MLCFCTHEANNYKLFIRTCVEMSSIRTAPLVPTHNNYPDGVLRASRQTCELYCCYVSAKCFFDGLGTTVQCHDVPRQTAFGGRVPRDCQRSLCPGKKGQAKDGIRYWNTHGICEFTTVQDTYITANVLRVC